MKDLKKLEIRAAKLVAIMRIAATELDGLVARALLADIECLNYESLPSDYNITEEFNTFEYDVENILYSTSELLTKSKE